jgi:hypothetical protein
MQPKVFASRSKGYKAKSATAAAMQQLGYFAPFCGPGACGITRNNLL